MIPKNPIATHKRKHLSVLSGRMILTKKMLGVGSIAIFVSCFGIDGMYSCAANALESKADIMKTRGGGGVGEYSKLHHVQMRGEGNDGHDGQDGDGGGNASFSKSDLDTSNMKYGNLKEGLEDGRWMGDEDLEANMTEEDSSEAKLGDGHHSKTLSKYGRHIKDTLERLSVKKGDTWEVWHDGSVLSDWIVQHPPAKYLGKSSSMLPVAENCESGDDCNTDFHLKTCASDGDCNRKKFCHVKSNTGPVWECAHQLKDAEYFERGMCKRLDSTQKSVDSQKQKLCVGHSFGLYEQMFNHIIQAQSFVDITSLDSFDLMGYAPYSSGLEFAAVIRNAISYLASTGRRITIRIHFGTIGLSKENCEHIAKELWPKKNPGKIDLHVTSYRTDISSWNHGKILAVDGDKLFMGGTNYYTEHYLREDPVFDVDLQVQGSAAVTAHMWANKLHKAACDLSSSTVSYYVDYAWRAYDNKARNDGVAGCPPAFVSKVHRHVVRQSEKSTPITIIPTARLGALADMKGGQKTSDLAMYSMVTTADKSIKFSQQDMLPVILYGVMALGANEGYKVGYTATTGLGVFDDTWRQTQAIAKAIAKNVKVSIMLSAPCAQGGVKAFSKESFLGSMEKCPENGKQGKGYDYWSKVYGFNNYNWPAKRPIDKKDLFIDPSDQKTDVTTSGHRGLLQGGYGYGWSLDNTADWIYAYFAIFKEERPINKLTGKIFSDGEVVNLICSFTEIGHIRLTKEEETYMRISKKNPERKYAGGQVGNHAKVVIVDDSIFYVGSDNMYGAGLAEFGLVIDDQAKTKEFVTEYFEPHWKQVLGTQEIPGLVTGGSRLVTGCPWKERLPVRPKPWSDIKLVLAYGDKALLNLAVNGEKWLSNDSSVKTKNAQKSLNEISKSQWVFRSQLGDGSRLSPDPMQETCVKYGDKVYLQVFNEDKKWLSGGRSGGNYKVLLRDRKLDSDDFSYQWIVRSSIGHGSRSTTDPIAGECVSEKDLIYLQVNSLDDRFLTGHHNHEVFTKDFKTSNAHGKTYYKWSVEMSAENLGHSCWGDEECDSGRCSTNYICEPLLANGERCGMNDDCISGRCESSFTLFHRTCTSKAGEYSSCNENSDCQNDECTWGYICGQGCSLPTECDTGRCSNRFTCEPQLEEGESCSVNPDCKSNNCQWPQMKCGRGCTLDSHCKDTESCSWGYMCVPKSDVGEGCSEDDDCKTGGCSLMFTCGKTCKYDTDCPLTGRCSTKYICEPKLTNGQWCGEDDDCKSGRCDGTFACSPMSKEGESCLGDNDCMAGKCSWAYACGRTCAFDSHCSSGRCSKNLICEPKLPNGNGCLEDDDCETGRCDMYFTCRNKLANGQWCGEHDDCLSNKCRWGWSGPTCRS